MHSNRFGVYVLDSVHFLNVSARLSIALTSKGLKVGTSSHLSHSQSKNNTSILESNSVINQVLLGDCLEIMKQLSTASCDLIFADPPYNLQVLKEGLKRPDYTNVRGAVEESWDHFASFREYDDFSIAWLTEAKRLLKKDATLWVMGSYHNIFRLGKILQDLGFWILNDVIWAKTNPMPNFRGVRFTNAQETLIWAAKEQKSRYYFNYTGMKAYNDDVQMTSVWHLPLCLGKKERLRGKNNKTLHPTQKPIALLNRVILSSTREGDLILDPFFGTGTTGVVAKILGRNFIGIEKEKRFYEAACERLKDEKPLDQKLLDKPLPKFQRVSLANLLEAALLTPGDVAYDHKGQKIAVITAGGMLLYKGSSISMNKLANQLSGGSLGAWDFWYVKTHEGKLSKLRCVRDKYFSLCEVKADEPNIK